MAIMTKENIVTTTIAGLCVVMMLCAGAWVTKQGVVGFCKMCVWLAKECA